VAVAVAVAVAVGNGGTPGAYSPGVPVPGPLALGRGVVVRDGEVAPEPWRGAPVVRIDEATLAEPAEVVTRLHRAWSAREPVVVALAVDPGSFRAPATWDDAPWALGPWFEP